MTRDYPINLQLQGRLCVVVGGGNIGQRKIAKLMRAGARVRVITLPPPPLAASHEPAELILRPYREGDLAGALLAFAATDSRHVNAAVAEEARRQRILVNIADDAAASDFHLPACLNRGDLSIAVSTAGRSPALAAQIRDHLGRVLGPEWSFLLEIAAALRQKRLTLNEKADYNQTILHHFIERDFPSLIARGAADEIDTALTQLLGPGTSLAELGIHLPKGMP